MNYEVSKGLSTVDKIRLAACKLRSDDMVLYELHFEQGITGKELAYEFKVRLKTMEKRLLRIKNKIKKLVEGK